MKLHDLGHVPWLESQLLYHALPRTGRGGVILVAPATPYVCIGYHQDAAQEVDLEFCRASRIPVFRRQVGGGAVYLDGGQQFYQIVLPPDHPAARGDKETFYRRLLEPVVQTYRDFGIDASFKPVNDIVTGGRKVSGNGAAEIAGHHVLVGNVILDFDHEMMSRVLRVPDEKFRDKVFKSLKDNLTTMRQELGRVPPWTDVKASLVRNLQTVLGPLEPAALPDDVREQARALEPVMTSEDWLMRRGRIRPNREVRIASGVDVARRAFKAPGGLIRATLEFRDGRIASVELSGDFFVYPADSLAGLEAALTGAIPADAESVISAFCASHSIETPGITPADIARVLVI